MGCLRDCAMLQVSTQCRQIANILIDISIVVHLRGVQNLLPSRCVLVLSSLVSISITRSAVHGAVPCVPHHTSPCTQDGECNLSERKVFQIVIRPPSYDLRISHMPRVIGKRARECETSGVIFTQGSTQSIGQIPCDPHTVATLCRNFSL